jgi:phosphonate transport system substrate-binding protein
VDGAAVDSLVYRFAVARDASLAERTRVIYRSPPFAAPPVVTSPHIRAQLRAQLEDTFIGMASDPAAAAALRALNVDGFVPIEDTAYDSVRRLQRDAALRDLP